jgi:hypothetical protein
MRLPAPNARLGRMPDDGSDERQPGYCVVCGDFHLVTPVPGRSGGVCGNPSCRERLEPYEPGPRHVCNLSDRLKPGHPEYRQCSCGQWLHSAGGYWYRVRRPPVRWLREHGLSDAGEFWADGDDEEPGVSFGEFYTSIGGWRFWLRSLLQRLGFRS